MKNKQICGKYNMREYTCNLLKIGYDNHHMSVTYQPKVKKRKTTHGFLVRQATTSGRKTIRNRRRKGRAKLAV